MANPNPNRENLALPINKRPKKERDEITRKGAEASNKVQKKKRAIRDYLEMIGKRKLNDKQKEALSKSFNLSEEELDALNWIEAISMRLFANGLAKGDVKAIREIYDRLEGKPKQEIDTKIRVPDKIKIELVRPKPIKED